MSIVYFNINGKSYECKVKQPFGGKDGTYDVDALEVHLRKELRGKIHLEQFHDAIESYYRKQICSNGMLKIDNVKNLSVFNTFFELYHDTEVHSESEKGGW